MIIPREGSKSIVVYYVVYNNADVYFLRDWYS